MVCKYCQAELEDGSTVCHVCGKALEEELLPETPAQEEPVEEMPEQAAEEPIAGEAEQPEEADEQVSEEEKAAEEKEKKRDNLLVKITAFVSCAVLLFALAAGIWAAVDFGAGKKNELLGNACYAVEDSEAIRGADTVVATIGTGKLTNGQLQMLYWDQIYNFINEYYNYLTYLGLDYTKPLHEQTTGEDGTTWEQYFLQGALDTWHQYQALSLEAEKNGFVLPESMQTFLDELPETMLAAATSNGFATADDMAAGDYGPGSTGKIYEDYLRLYYTAVSYFDSLYAALEASEEEIEAYYGKNADKLETNYGVTKDSGRLIDVRHILIGPKSDTTDEAGNAVYSEEDWEACRQEAQALLDTFLAGDATEEAFAQLATEHTEDPGSQNTGGLYEMVRQGQMVATFDDWCFDQSRKPGDTGLVKSDFGYHIMYFVYGEEGWIRYSTDGVLTDKGAQLLESILQAYPMEVNYKKIGLGQIELG